MRQGFTLVEILVVISILLILTALLVPNIRTVTKDRNAREAARVVGSVFSLANQRAVSDGVAGVVLFRNENFLIDTNGDNALNPADDFSFAVTSLGLLRRVPNYTGDFPGAQAIISPTPPPAGAIRLRMPLPIEQTALNLISPGDRIALNNSTFDYPISQAFINPTPLGTLDLIVPLGDLPNPTALILSLIHI